jgi:hypothetical protein
MKKFLRAVPCLLVFSPIFSADTPWTPSAQHFDADLSVVYQAYDHFWLGDTKLSTKDAFGDDGKVTQTTATLSGVYGITDWLAADLSVGYTDIDFKPLDETDSGLNDTTLGLQARVLDENNSVSPYLPTISFRLGAILKGTYDTDVGAPTAAGLGTNGYDLSLALGKFFVDTGTGVFASGGFRDYASDIPTSRYWALGAFQDIAGQASVHAIYRSSASTSGVDIGGPGFTGDFTKVKEERESIEGGVTYIGYADARIGFFVARVIDGRNVGQDLVLGLNGGYSF